MCETKIVAYFEATWNKVLNVVVSFRLILFNQTESFNVTKAFFTYIDYLFEVRGCNAFNWCVAEKNEHAYKLYEKFVNKYMGHKIGKRHFGQKSYTGVVSDIYLYEITKDEYFAWKNKKNN